LKVAVPGKNAFTPDGAHLITVDFAGDCQGKVEIYLRIKQLIEARYADAGVGIRLDIRSGSVAIPTDSNLRLVLYSSAESLRIPGWIEVIHPNDFRFCPNLREVIASLQREISGFRDCRKLKRVELSRSVEVIGRDAFSAEVDGGGRSAEARQARKPLFLTVGDESWLRRRRRGCQIFIAEKGPKKEENREIVPSGIISHLMAKCGGNVHDMGLVEITASSVFSDNSPQNAADRENDSYFRSESKPDQWICWDFKILRIEPTHYTVQTGDYWHLKSWVVEGSDNGTSWTEIDQHRGNYYERKSYLSDRRDVKTFAVLRPGSFGMIRLRLTRLYHNDGNCHVLGAFELFGAVARLPDDFVKFCFPTVPVFPFTWARFNGVISYLTAKYGGNVHDKGVVEITASSVEKSWCGTEVPPRNTADIKSDSYFESENKPDQWICWDFKTLIIEPTYYTVRSSFLKRWVVEGSDDGTSWTEIDRREDNSDLNVRKAVKTFAISQSGSFRRIRLLQRDLNHSGNNQLKISAFELFGAVAGLQ
jgi:hypothetical protein